MNTFGLAEEYRFFDSLSPEELELFSQGFHLLHHIHTIQEENSFEDYSFVVFPFSKAYEGFLKRIFFEAHFISGHSYRSKYFRVGKVLSPNLMKKLGQNSVYKKLLETMGKDGADRVWDAWKTCRNEVFHYFPESHYHIDFTGAKERIKQLLDVCEEVFMSLR
jgi:hypothetical protein